MQVCNKKGQRVERKTQRQETRKGTDRMKHYAGVIKRNDGKYYSRYSSTYLGVYDSVLEAVMARDKEKIRRQELPKKERKRISIEGFSERLNQAIWDSDTDVSEICRRAGISRSCLWTYRYTATMPPSGILAKIAVALNVSTDWLLGLEK